MSTVQIDSTDFTVYADVGEADAYALGALHADAWRLAGGDTKKIALVTATRILDRQRWGSACSTFDDRSENENIVNAAIELAIALVAGSPVQESQSVAQTISSLKAGSVALTYFRGAEGAPLRFPLPVTELLRASECWGGAGSPVAAAISSGTDGCSVSDDDFSFSEAP